jgi:5-methyltetrahydrofolate--homocysteine methyltransferase
LNTILRSATKTVTIGSQLPFVIIGEKINPTGSKILGKALSDNNFEFIKELAIRQTSWGADVLDVNVGQPGVQETTLIVEVVRAIQSVSDLPVCIDSSDPFVLEAGLHEAKGKPLVNSVNAEEKQLRRILPIVKDRGAAVIGLTIDDNGIPKTAEERVAAADKIITRASALGIAVEDIIIDPLVLTVGADNLAAMVTLQTISLLRNNFGVNINLGASNVSFGLPDRATINSAFLPIAIHAGATCSITDPMKLGSLAHATDLLLGRDQNSIRFLKYFRAAEKLRHLESEVANNPG